MNAATPQRYRQVEVGGTPLQMGLAIGEQARDEVRGFAAVALERVRKTVAISADSARTVAAESLRYAQDYHPDACEELRGVARAANLALEELMLLQVRNQLQADDAGCTAVSLAPPAAAVPVVAQNWDNDPALDPFTIVLVRRPQGKPASMTLTQAGLVAYIGCNDSGIGVCLNTLPAPSRGVGVPHYFTVRALLESRSREQAVNEVRRALRAIPANIILASPEGPADLEVTIDDVHVLTDEGGSGVVTHTNHCLHPALASINDQFPELIESGPRKQRIDELLAAVQRPVDVAAVQRMLADHDRLPYSICRHANDAPDTGYWETVFSVVIQPTAGRMYVSRGNPCQAPYETYELVRPAKAA